MAYDNKLRAGLPREVVMFRPCFLRSVTSANKSVRAEIFKLTQQPTGSAAIDALKRTTRGQ
jgi:hypothetical protein